MRKNQSQDDKVEGKEESKVAEEEKTHWAYEGHSWRFISVDILCLWKTWDKWRITNIKNAWKGCGYELNNS